ncbi:MAG TPA: MotA/TolQ/ExbB proton channel family protein [Kiritimatiellia bacterium]|nr:MotA/TolQ/ExbB proton channel family protein [Kiritimatiellia bacterium]HMP00272.1 MotA/TolQ/ExbB proton channel family protein [Kiritimatiellia bacterium]HMP96989.1 MotA/TolQ/ExbB proton channel family protein [Kiritimatiellia bacterium]
MTIDILGQGGPVMWLIAAIGATAAIVFLQRLFHLHRAQIKTTDFIRGIFTIVNKGNIVEAVSQCEETPGPVAQMVRMAILEREQGPERVRQVMREVGLAEIPRLERNLSLLLTLGQIAPLAGLLGTVLGMLEILAGITAQAPQVYAGDLSHGLWSALLTTAAGLGAAIPIYAGYNLLVSRVESILLDMERVFGEVMMLLGPTAPATRPGA